MAHSLCSPSSAHRWVHCVGAPVFESFYPDEESTFAQEGTNAHALAAYLLAPKNNPAPEEGAVPPENVDFVQEYVDFVREHTAGAKVFRIEHPLCISQVTHEPDARGTADCLAIVDDELRIIDLKFGRGVKVDAQENDQLIIYALAALDEFSLLEEINTVEMTIHQPRLGHVSQAVYTVEELEAKREHYAERAESVLTLREQVKTGAPIPFVVLKPTEKGCKFCKAKAECPALARFLTEATGIEVGVPPVDVFPQILLDDGALLAKKLSSLDRLEAYANAIRTRAMERLSNGQPVPGYKLVQGRKGARRWADESAVAALLADIPEDEVYTKKLVTPAQVDRLVKRGAIEKDLWKKVCEQITQADGSPTIAPEADERPALQTDADFFTAI